MGVRSRPASAKVRSLIMCGIFAYLNHLTPKTRAEVIDLLIKGLKRLEYRGYDSAGIGIDGPNGNASIALLKSTGKVKSLEDKIEAQKANLNVEGVHTQHVGIAHTRSNSKIVDKSKKYVVS